MRLRLALAAAAILALAVPAAAVAHPLGNFSINHYLDVVVGDRGVQVELLVDVAEIPAVELVRGVDDDADGRLTRAERRREAERLCRERLPAIDLRLDGVALALELEGSILDQQPGAGGLPTVRLACRLASAARIGPGDRLSVTNGADAGRLGWREIVIRGDGLSLAPSGAGHDVSRGLRAYPADLLERPLDERRAVVTVEGTGPPLDDTSPVAGAAAAVPGGAGADLPFVPDFDRLSLGAGIVGLVLAAVAGAGHALSPGHGKTVMAAYLLGSRGRAGHAILLGAAVTASHTLGVLLLAGVVLLAADRLPPERLFPILSTVSGAAVTVIGAALLVGCLRRRRPMQAEDGPHRHGLRVHRHAPHAPAHDDDPAPRMPGVRGLLAIGVAGGLVPSTAALVLLLAAVAAGQALYGLALAVAFGLGMAGVLTAVGLAIVTGRDRLAGVGPKLSAGLPVARRLAGAAPWVLALVVLLGGLALTGQALGTQL